MNPRPDSEKRKIYKSPSIATLGTVGVKTAGPASAAADGAPGYQHEHPYHGVSHIEVRIPKRRGK